MRLFLVQGLVSLIGGAVLAPARAEGQAVNLQIILPSAANMPRSIAAWQANPAVVQVRIGNTGVAPLQGLRFRFVVRGPTGETVRSRNGQEPVFGLGGGETRGFLLEEVVNINAVDYPSDIELRIARDGIPEGAYTICAFVVDAAGQSVSGPERCFSFRINEPDPPTLIRPGSDQAVLSNMVRFQWTPVRMPAVSYRLTIKPRFAGQTPTGAMGANPVLFSEVVPTTFYQYLPSDPDFKLYDNAIGFVWQVQSLLDEIPVGRNRGLSPVGSFTFTVATQPEEKPADNAAPVDAPACGVGATNPPAPASRQPGNFAAASLAGRTVRVGFFQLTVQEASGSPGSLSGTGTVQVPFLERSVPVRFENLGVNSRLEAFSGAATGTEEENASLPVDWMNSTAKLSGIRFESDNAFIDASLTYDFAMLNQTLGFAGRALRITPSGIQSGSGRIGLAADIDARFGDATLRLKGSASAESGSYVQWGCAGFERAQIVMEQEFPRTWLVPVDATGNPRAGNARMTFTVELKAGQPWTMPVGTLERATFGFAPGFIIEPASVVLDMTSSANPERMAFPPGFQGITGEAWTGVFIESFSLALPEALRRFGTTDPIRVSAKNMLIDRSGVSMEASLANIMAVNQGNLGGWGFSIDQLRLTVVSSSLTQGSLVGKVQLPISTVPVEYTAMVSVPDEASGTQQASQSRSAGAASSASRLAAAAAGEQSGPGLRYDFQIKPAEEINASIWGPARMKLEPTSKIAVSVQKVNNKWEARPTMELHGAVSITQEVELVGMKFQGLKFQTTAPYVQKGTWSLASPQHYLGGADDAGGAGDPTAGAEPASSAAAAPGKVGGLPITITNVEVIAGLEGQAISAGLRFTAGVSLPGATTFLSGNTTIRVLGKIDRPANGPMTPRFDRIQPDQICVAGGMRNVMEVKRGSCLNFFRNDRTFGTGASGSIGVVMMKGIDVTSNVRFGSVSGFDYFYVDGQAVMRTGVPFPGINAVGVYGFNGGLFFHMNKQGLGTSARYVPTSSIVLGLRGGITLGTYPRPEPMNGDLTLEGAFTRAGGLSYVSLLGNGYMMTPVVNRPATVPVRMSMDLTFNVPNETLDGLFQVNINASRILTGNGSARLHASRSKFLLHAGVGGSTTRPVITDGSKFTVNIGPLWTAKAYLATGTAGTLPPFPALPPGAAQPSGSARSSTTAAASNGGVMFGAKIALRFSADGGVAGADVNGEAGFDVALQDYGTRRCFNQQVGMNGWYANGQLYSWIEASGWVGMSESVTEWINDGFEWIADVGCEIASWFGGCDKKKRAKYKQVVRIKPVRYEIARARAAATFQAGLPSPTWYAGTVEVNYRALGAIKGSTSIPFTQGNRCSL